MQPGGVLTSVIEAGGGELLGKHGRAGGPAAEGLQTGRVGPHARVGHGAPQRVLELPAHERAVGEVSQVFGQSAVTRLPVAQLPATGEAGHSVPRSHIVETGSGQILRRRGGQGPGLEGEQPVLRSLQGSLTGAGPPGSKLPVLSEVYGTRWEAGIRPAEIARGLQAGRQRVCGARGGRRLRWRTAGSGLRGCAQTPNEGTAGVQLPVLLHGAVSRLPVVQHQAAAEAPDLVVDAGVVKPRPRQAPLRDGDAGRERRERGHAVQLARVVVPQLKRGGAFQQAGQAEALLDQVHSEGDREGKGLAFLGGGSFVHGSWFGLILVLGGAQQGHLSCLLVRALRVSAGWRSAFHTRISKDHDGHGPLA